ncbi:MAG: aminotransferase class I/II-fold pyridoxal phosphate-dependent enzyme [Acidobacteria bacterium]|nr:aminotransferase class I/II-fold pyridoxal phosphate-dependent enzyme [Acidobacteriota bacterium]
MIRIMPVRRRDLFASAALPLLAAEGFDFDTPYNRIGTDSTKWDAQLRRYGKDSIIAGMGISDTDFRSAPVITAALQKRLQHENWGYLTMPASFPQAIIDWNKHRYGITIHPDRLLLAHGVHPSIISAIRAFSPQGSKVLLLTPTYDGFFGDITAAGCIAEQVPLKQSSGRYQLDLEALDRHISHDTNTIIICNPNNPTGNVWSRDELSAVGELCTKRRVVLLVDEIHCDLMTKGNQYTPFSLLSNREVVNNSIIFKSASKSFNLSALRCSWMYSENSEYMKRIAATGHSTDINTLGVIAAQAALTQGEPWLNQLITYIDGNHDFTADFIKTKIPLLSYNKPQGTYLAWVDVSRLIDKIGAKAQADKANQSRPATARPITAEMILQDWLVKNAKVQLNAGTNYGHSGTGRMRMNLGTSRQTLNLALSSIAAACNSL